MPVRLHAREDALPARLGGGQGVLLRHELGAGRDLLGRLAREHGGLAGDLGLRQPRLLARHLELAPEPADLHGDRLVLAADLLEVLELVDEVAEALHLEQDPERVGLLALVELDQALLEACLRDRELLLEVLDPAGLVLHALLEPVELVAMDGEVGLELGDHGRERADVAAEGVDPLAGSLDLGGEDAFLPLGVLDLLAEAGDLPVELGLPVGGRLGQRGRHGQRNEHPEEAGD